MELKSLLFDSIPYYGFGAPCYLSFCVGGYWKQYLTVTRENHILFMAELNAGEAAHEIATQKTIGILDCGDYCFGFYNANLWCNFQIYLYFIVDWLHNDFIVNNGADYWLYKSWFAGFDQAPLRDFWNALF